MDYVTYLARSSTPVFKTILKVSVLLTGILDAVPVVAHKTKGSTQTSGFARCHAKVTGYTSSGCLQNTIGVNIRRLPGNILLLVVKTDDLTS